MSQKILILLAALITNTLLVFVVVSPEFVSYAEVEPRGVAACDLIKAATAGREQILGVIHAQHTTLFVLAVANLAVVLWALRRGKP